MATPGLLDTPADCELGDTMKRLVAAATAALVTLLIGGCGESETETITNDNGTWEGTWEGTSTFGEGAADDEHFHDVTYTLLGTGDYDGLEFVFHMEGFEHPWPLEGTISPV